MSKVLTVMENEMNNAIQWYKGRQVSLGTMVKTYFNLHRNVFSIIALEGEYKGKVIGHAPALLLAHATFSVGQAGRNRVIKEKRKNVHAFVKGRIATAITGERVERVKNQLAAPDDKGVWVSYNPYLKDHFYIKDSEDKIESCRGAYLIDKKVRAYL